MKDQDRRARQRLLARAANLHGLRVRLKNVEARLRDYEARLVPFLINDGLHDLDEKSGRCPGCGYEFIRLDFRQPCLRPGHEGIGILNQIEIYRMAVASMRTRLVESERYQGPHSGPSQSSTRTS